MGNDIRDEILAQVLPDDEEREQLQDLFDRIRSFIADEFGREARLMGSTAKDTFIAGDRDLDIFVFFDTDTPRGELEGQGLDIGEAVFEEFDGTYAVEYAEHPYTRGEIEEYDVEIVPAYDVASGEDIRSAVDRTPFHTAWVDDNLDAAQKREVVLLKAFLRGQGLYGSTLRVEGFSGYLCELLIAAYGSFQDVLEAAVDWAEDEVLDPGDHHDPLPNHLREKFSEDALVVIDPVDPERNVAAVLSRENYARFVYAAWNYLRDPDTTYFFPEKQAPDAAILEAAADDRGDFVMVSFPRPDLVDDLLYPQIRRLMRRLRTELDEHEFELFESGFHVGEDEVRLLFELHTAELPASRKHVGPKVFHNETHVKQFTDKYEDVWVEGARLTTIVDREHATAQALLEDVLSGDLQSKGVPEQLTPVVADRTVSGIAFDDEAWNAFLRDTFHMG